MANTSLVNPRTATIVMFAFLLLGFILPIGLAGTLFSGTAGPEGVQAQQPMVMTDPQTAELQDLFKSLADPDALLTDTTKLQAVEAGIQKLVSALKAGDSSYSSISDKQKALAIAEEMLTQLATIKTNAVSNKAVAQQARDAFLKNKVSLESLFAIGGGSPPKDGFALPINANNITGYGNSAHRCSKDSSICYPGHRPLLKGGKYDLGLLDDEGSATDISARPGSPVFAPFSGKVVRSNCVHSNCSDASFIVIQSPDKRYVAALLHITNQPKEGENVQAGQQVGQVGNIGYDHLHFELWIDGHVIWSNGDSGNPNKVIWDHQKKALGF